MHTEKHCRHRMCIICVRQCVATIALRSRLCSYAMSVSHNFVLADDVCWYLSLVFAFVFDCGKVYNVCTSKTEHSKMPICVVFVIIVLVAVQRFGSRNYGTEAKISTTHSNKISNFYTFGRVFCCAFVVNALMHVKYRWLFHWWNEGKKNAKQPRAPHKHIVDFMLTKNWRNIK